MKQNQSKHAAPIETSINAATIETSINETSETSFTTAEEVHRATSMPEVSPIMASTQAPAKSSNSADAVMGGRSNVLSHQQLLDVDYALKKVKGGSGIWPFPNSWYCPPSGPKLGYASSKDPAKYFSVPVLLYMPVVEFSSRFQNCPCAEFGYKHSRVVSNGYTEPCRVVGMDYTYAMVGNRYMCQDCKDLGTSSYTFNSYDERFMAFLPPDIR